MTQRILIDTGPLVAIFSERDQHHAWARAQLEAIHEPMHTCEPVLTDACFLLGGYAGGADRVFAALQLQTLLVPFRVEPERASLDKLMRRYADQPMSLADACLVRMSELDPSAVVLTIDRDFRIYRRNGREVVPTRMPPDR